MQLGLTILLEDSYPAMQPLIIKFSIIQPKKLCFFLLVRYVIVRILSLKLNSALPEQYFSRGVLFKSDMTVQSLL